MEKRFEKEIKHLKISRRMDLFVCAVAICFVVLFLYASQKGVDVLWYAVFPLSVIFIEVPVIVSTSRLIKQFSKIDVQKVSEAKIYRPRIKFLTVPDNIIGRRFRQKYFGMKIFCSIIV